MDCVGHVDRGGDGDLLVALDLAEVLHALGLLLLHLHDLAHLLVLLLLLVGKVRGHAHDELAVGVGLLGLLLGSSSSSRSSGLLCLLLLLGLLLGLLLLWQLYDVLAVLVVLLLLEAEHAGDTWGALLLVLLLLVLLVALGLHLQQGLGLAGWAEWVLVLAELGLVGLELARRHWGGLLLLLVLLPAEHAAGWVEPRGLGGAVGLLVLLLAAADKWETRGVGLLHALCAEGVVVVVGRVLLLGLLLLGLLLLFLCVLLGAGLLGVDAVLGVGLAVGVLSDGVDPLGLGLLVLLLCCLVVSGGLQDTIV